MSTADALGWVRYLMDSYQLGGFVTAFFVIVLIGAFLGAFFKSKG